jgi:phage-related protein
MAEKVIVKSSTSDLDGSQFDNAATEATLLRLVNLMEKNKTGSGASVNSMAERSRGMDPKAIKAADEGLSGIGSSSKDASSSVSKMASSFGSAVSLLASGPLALLGSAFSMITGTIGDSVEALRTTGAVGASFNGSLLELNKAAAGAGMGLQEYSKFVANNAQLMANLGGTATEGAKRMGELSKELRTSQVGQQMMALGISADTMNGALGDYMKIEAQQGRLQGKSTAELTKGSGEYLKSLGELSRLTGKNVDEMSKNIEAMQRDEKINALMQDMSVTKQKEFALQMERLNSISPELAKAFKDGMIGLGDNDLWNQLANISPETKQLAEDMKKGNISTAQFNNAMSKLGPEIKDKLKDMPVEARAAFEPFLKLGPISSDLNKNQEMYSEAAQARAKREGEASKPFTDAIMNAGNALSAFWGELKLTFLESGIFKRISGVVDWAAQKFIALKDPMVKFVKTILDQALPILDKMGEILTDVVNSIISFVAPYIPIVGKMLKDIGKALSDTIDDIMEFVKPYIPMVGKLFSDIAETIRSNIKPAMEILDTVIGNAGRIINELLIPIITDLWSDMKDLVTGVIEIGKSIWDSLMPAFKGVSDSFFSFLPSMDDTIKILKEWKPAIVGLIESFVLFKAVTGAWSLMQTAATAISAAWSAATTIGAAGMWALIWPVAAVVAAVVSLGLIFKSLYDSGWTLGTAFDAITDPIKRFGMNLMDLVDKMLGLLPSWAGGLSDEEKKQREKIREDARKQLDQEQKDRDVKRAEVRRDRGTENSAFNLSGPAAAGPATPGSPAAKKQEDELNYAKKKAEDESKKAIEAAEQKQKEALRSISPALGTATTAALSAPKAPEATAAPPPPRDYEKIRREAREKSLGRDEDLTATQFEKDRAQKASDQAVAEAKAADAKEARERQVATLNTVSEQLYTLNEVMKEILKLNKDQAEAQKDLVNVTKGRYNPV